MKSTILLMPLALLFTVSSYGSTMCSAADGAGNQVYQVEIDWLNSISSPVGNLRSHQESALVTVAGLSQSGKFDAVFNVYNQPTRCGGIEISDASIGTSFKFRFERGNMCTHSDDATMTVISDAGKAQNFQLVCQYH